MMGQRGPPGPPGPPVSYYYKQEGFLLKLFREKLEYVLAVKYLLLQARVFTILGMELVLAMLRK